MRCSTLGDRCLGQRRRREQRMSEPDHAVRALDHVGSDRRSERLLVDSGRLHELERRRAGHSHDEQRLPRLLRQRAQSLADEVLERVGYRQRLRGIERRSHVERPRQLEREEGIAARCIVQPQQGRTWESESEPVTDETLDRADAERPDGQSLDHSGKRRLERRRRLAAAGEEDPDRLAVEPPQREREHIRRRRIEPLDVVDREQQRAAGGQRDERVVHPDRERARICRDVPLGIEQQRRLERPTPWRREHRQHFGGGFPEQVAEPGVRESLLGLGGPRGKHTEPSLARRLRPGQPERRLADARLAFEHEGGGTFRGPLDEVEQGGEFLVSSDDVHPHVGHGDTAYARFRACAPTIGCPCSASRRECSGGCGRKREELRVAPARNRRGGARRCTGLARWTAPARPAGAARDSTRPSSRRGSARRRAVARDAPGGCSDDAALLSLSAASGARRRRCDPGRLRNLRARGRAGARRRTPLRAARR